MCVCYFFYMRIKFEKGKKRTNVLTTCSPNFSQFGQAAADLELEMHVQITNFLLSRNREKLKFGGIRVLLLIQISHDGG